MQTSIEIKGIVYLAFALYQYCVEHFTYIVPCKPFCEVGHILICTSHM